MLNGAGPGGPLDKLGVAIPAIPGNAAPAEAGRDGRSGTITEAREFSRTPQRNEERNWACIVLEE